MKGYREANSQSQMGYTVRASSEKICVKISRPVSHKQYHPETPVNGTYL